MYGSPMVTLNDDLLTRAELTSRLESGDGEIHGRASRNETLLSVNISYRLDRALVCCQSYRTVGLTRRSGRCLRNAAVMSACACPETRLHGCLNANVYVIHHR